MKHRDLTALQAGLDHIRQSPRDRGTVELIVRRPAENERELLNAAVIDLAEGLVGDNWSVRGSRFTEDGSAHPGMQLTLMNSRVAALVAGAADRWQLAGDQLYVDLDLSYGNLPPGTPLAVGTALIEVTDEPHRGCGKFAARFGTDAQRFVNSQAGRELNLRGINATVLAGGIVRAGDPIGKAPG